MSKRKPRSTSNLPRCYLYKIRGCRFAYGFFWYAVIVGEGEPPIGMYQERCAPFMVRLFQPYVIVQPVTWRRSVESCVLYTPQWQKECALFSTLAMQTLLTFRAETLLKLVDPALPFLQRRLPWGPSARLIFLEQGNQRLQVLG